MCNSMDDDVVLTTAADAEVSTQVRLPSAMLAFKIRIGRVSTDSYLTITGKQLPTDVHLEPFITQRRAVQCGRHCAGAHVDGWRGGNGTRPGTHTLAHAPLAQRRAGQWSGAVAVCQSGHAGRGMPWPFT